MLPTGDLPATGPVVTLPARWGCSLHTSSLSGALSCPLPRGHGGRYLVGWWSLVLFVIWAELTYKKR